MRRIYIFLFVLLVIFAINLALGQDKGVNCYTMKSLGPFPDSLLPQEGNPYLCCKDYVTAELSFHLTNRSGDCRIEGLVAGSDVSIQVFSEDYYDGDHKESASGYSGRMTSDTLKIDVATGSTFGHFSNISLTAWYND